MSLPKTFSSGERLFASDLNDNFDDLDGRVDTVETSGYRFAGTRYYTSSGTFAKADPLGAGDIGLRAVRIRLVGAGGSGAGILGTLAATRNPLAPSGGSSGGYAEAFVLASSLLSSETVTCGSGGAGSTGAGNSGGATSFGSHAAASGGGGGVNLSNTAGTQTRRPGEAGIGTAGDLLIKGTPGLSGSIGTFITTGGSGGSSFFGGGATPNDRSADGIGGNAGSVGGGGGAAIRHSGTGTNYTSGAGGNGVVIVDCFV
jgi:hypothetical protein